MNHEEGYGGLASMTSGGNLSDTSKFLLAIMTAAHEAVQSGVPREKVAAYLGDLAEDVLDQSRDTKEQG